MRTLIKKIEIGGECELKVYEDLTSDEEKIVYEKEAKRKNE